MKPKNFNGTISTLCIIAGGIISIIGGIFSQKEQMDKLEELNREYHEDKNAEAAEEEV